MATESLGADGAHPWRAVAASGNTLAGLAAVLAAGIVMFPVLSFEFVMWDDNRIVAALDAAGAWRDWWWRTDVTNLFTPLSVSLFRLLGEVFGPRPGAFHGFALALHLFNVLAVYALVLRFSPAGPRPSTVWVGALAAALLWGLNPLRVEVVGWVAALPYAFATSLALLAVHVYVLPRSGPADAPTSRRAFAGFTTFYLAAMLAHPVTTPLAVAPMLFDWLAGRPLKPRRGIYLLLFLLAAISIGGQVYVRTVLGGGNHSAPGLLSLAGELAKALGFVADFSLLHAWWPREISLVYAGYEVRGWASVALWCGIALLAVLLAFGTRAANPGRRVFIVWLAIHVALALPAAGVGVINYLLADRYLYLLSLPTAVVAGTWFNAWLSSESRQPRHAAAAITTAAALVLGYSLWTVSQLPHWRATGPLLDRLVITAPSRYWELFAKLRRYDDLRHSGVTGETLDQALMTMVEVKHEGRFDYPGAFSSLLGRGRCVEAHRLFQLVAPRLAAGAHPVLLAQIASCAATASPR